jgi:voltage-gated potassium channel
MLSAFWLALLVVELVWGLSPLLEGVGLLIWGLFVAEFVFRLGLAPARIRFLRANWLTAVSLLTPALRLLRVVRLLRVAPAARLARGARLIKVLGGVNRALGNLRRLLGRRRLGLVLALTIVVVVLGSAGMYALEGGQAGEGIQDFGEALWFTAMIITTLGSEYWPETTEGRLLTFLLALYAFAIFGYLAGALASFFIGRDAEEQEGEVAGSAELLALTEEVAALRQELSALSAKLEGAGKHAPPAPDS